MLKQTREPTELDLQQRVEMLENTLESLREETEVMHVLLGLSSALMEVSTVEETLEKAVRIVKDTFGADRCFAASWDPSRARFTVSSHHGYEPRLAAVLTAYAGTTGGFGLLRRVLGERAPVLVDNAVGEEALQAEEATSREVSSFIGIPLTRRGEDFGALGVEFARPRRFGSKEAALARGISRQVAVALTNARRLNLLQTLRTFGLHVGRAPLSVSAVGREVVAGAAELLGADAASVHFMDESHGTLVLAVQQGLSNEVEARLARIDVAGSLWSDLTEGRAVALPDARSHLDLRGAPTSVVAAAIPSSERRILGAIFLFFHQYFVISPDEIDALLVLSAQSATAIEIAQSYERQRHVASSLQRGLLTSEMPDLRGCDIGAIYEPAGGESEVGGDFYDVFDLPDGRFAVVVGDVSGKGAEAAAQMAMAKYMLPAFAMRNPSPSSVLFHLNNALAKGLGEERFATVVYGLFDPESRTCTLSVAGHPTPLLYRAGTSSVEPVSVDAPVLGVFEGHSFDYVEISMDPYDVLLLYTDGIPETRNSDKLYGSELLKRSFAHRANGATAQHVAQGIYEDAQKFGDVRDDAVVLALRCLPV
jgi:GAF domain-containing protein